MFLIRIFNNLLIYKIDQINQISILCFYFFHFLPQNISARSFLPFSLRNIFPHYLFITCCFRRRSSAKVPNFPLWGKMTDVYICSVQIQYINNVNAFTFGVLSQLFLCMIKTCRCNSNAQCRGCDCPKNNRICMTCKPGKEKHCENTQLHMEINRV